MINQNEIPYPDSTRMLSIITQTNDRQKPFDNISRQALNFKLKKWMTPKLLIECESGIQGGFIMLKNI